MVDEKDIKKGKRLDFVEIHKFCIVCGREKVERLATVRGQYKTIYTIIKAKFLCKDCNPFNRDYYGDILPLLSIKDGKMAGGVFIIKKVEDSKKEDDKDEN